MLFTHDTLFRYGLPVNFQAILLHPNKKSQKRLREVLNQLYNHLDSSALQGSSAADVRLLLIFVFVVLYYVSFSECRHSWFRVRAIRVLPLCLLQNKYRYD